MSNFSLLSPFKSNPNEGAHFLIPTSASEILDIIQHSGFPTNASCDKVPFNQKVLWTAWYSWCAPRFRCMESCRPTCQNWLNRITPVVTSGTILQLLASANLNDIDFSLNEDWALFSDAQKCKHHLWIRRYGLGSGIILSPPISANLP